MFILLTVLLCHRVPAGVEVRKGGVAGMDKSRFKKQIRIPTRSSLAVVYLIVHRTWFVAISEAHPIAIVNTRNGSVARQ